MRLQTMRNPGYTAEGARPGLVNRDPAAPAIDGARTFVGDVSRPDDMEGAVGATVGGASTSRS